MENHRSLSLNALRVTKLETLHYSPQVFCLNEILRLDMWHPAKPLLENRVKFVHCIVIIMHCLHKTMFASPFCFSKTPHLIQTPKTGSPEYFVLPEIGLQKPCL